ncbi:EEF1A lysine methyltransferase 1-like isoform X1 [Dendroctonus ponderosae]|uniref:EEF1A lysine methyltransferase 1 isoform X1 n=1 Tax=Dendroctonus ponderosae TaxID=77166 RepID=UPI002035F693|nr:EEF1A lysine methyltransferase 1 isoform X1 [Dendroctonus ponderosae]XP_048521439.1 EEF1A lysine methyltransferase 1-like isoform X1 [Dendroctonus ponderosae]XP_048525612.1 EEF1A lysine methyltransferase 1-like isoform X1 [Dendroctonus ponderosae]
MPSDEESELPQLSASAFAALQEFYKEQEEREAMEMSARDVSVKGDFSEDWQLSQFWYDERTIKGLVDMTLEAVGTNAKIALVSCPTLYTEMKQRAGPEAEVTLFEFDRRFAVFGGDFVFYDYRSPLNIPRDKSSYYDIVVADPPFLSDECLTKTAVTMKFLTKRRIILSTGAIMADLASRLLDLEKHKFEPHHRNNLANEFWCFTNFHKTRDVS